ncbi:MAG: glycoside hydrolase family 15 protein, partial [Chlorobiales bacterium]|nr:glycoside hydrolase family 15 protein [Chlorobiales bacterium]
ILSCRFTTENAEALLYDFMPVDNSKSGNKNKRSIHRCLKVIQGIMPFTLTLMPRPDYARIVPSFKKEDGNRFIISYGKENLTLAVNCSNSVLLSNEMGQLKLSLHLEALEEAHIDLFYGCIKTSDHLPCPIEENISFWQEWVHRCVGERCAYLGEFTPMVNRSLLLLKLLTFQPTGAIAAAPTTSIPETLGGERNWDYRFSWLRDASFTLKALFALGHVTEAESYLRWLNTTYRKYGSRNLQIMYTLQGNDRLKEVELAHLNGYQNSRPVRVGNNAHYQNQWDIYGEVMDCALRLSDYAGKIDEELWPFFREICSLAIENWQTPDDGIWEVRNGPYHFVYSKVMCWVALDRGITIARRFGFDAPLELWVKERDRIKDDILIKGFDWKLNSFVQKFGSTELDASLLLLPLTGFLPINDSRVQGTILACENQLMDQGFLLRYKAEDGLKGEEGGFVLCNFWLVECLALSGKTNEAVELLNKTLTASNHLGLFSEEFNSTTHEMLGNFPQAFSHIGYINAISAILAEKLRSTPVETEPSFTKWLRHLIPFQITLNDSKSVHPETTIAIGIELKQSLSLLQGAFFNTEKGTVNYEAMKQSEGFRKYLQLTSSLNDFNPESLQTDNEKKAFWINIYNILIIHGVIEFDIRGSVLEITNFFGRFGYKIGGFFFTPDDIEHGILRQNRPHPLFPFKPFSNSDPRRFFMVRTFDYRIHFALVCAASSCPPVEFYDARIIDQQLETAARSFINRKGMEIDHQTRTLWISSIFGWYSGDFGHNTRETVLSLLPYMTEEKRVWIEKNITGLHIRYFPYNWHLNSTLQ